jgi:hypothetical protein
MRLPTIAAAVLASAVLHGCGTKHDPKPEITAPAGGGSEGDRKADLPHAPGAKVSNIKQQPAASDGSAGRVDATDLPKEGAGDPALTYDVVKSNPDKYRGKRVTWAFSPLSSSEATRVMCALDMNQAIAPPHAGIYVVEFASNAAVGDAFFAAKAGTTVTATVAGRVDQFLAVRDGKGVQQKDVPKVSVPLLVYPTLNAGDGAKGKGTSSGKG